MRKFTFLIVISLAFITSAIAQTLVSTDVQQKNTVLEEYTGIHCTYCPEGHAIAQLLADENPGRVVLINIHQGSFANPSGGEPDFRTEFGDALAGQTGLTGYPSGTVNRHVFEGSNTALSRSAWTPAAQEIMSVNSPVNVGVETSYNDATRELTINVELFYTSDSPESTNLLNIALLQSHIFGPQTGGGAGNNYEHNHMLRHLITGQWGEEITTTTTGTFFQQTFTYTVPEDYNDVACIVEDCDIAVFVSETHQEIYSGVVVPAIDGTTLLTGSLTAPANIILEGTPSSISTFNMSFINTLPTNEDFEFTLTNDNAPLGWYSSFTINGNTYTSTGTESFESGIATDFSIDITPDNTSAFAKYTLNIQSVSNPNAPAISIDVYVVSNVVNLLLHNQGAWGNGQPSDFEEDYFTAFDYAEMTDYASCSYKSFLVATNADLVNIFDNIFFNVGWTFPSLTNENVVFLANFIDNGGNLFIAGQDMGWDTWESGGNGTINTRDFYTNYLNADYQGDGSASNNSINPNVNDEIYGELGTSSIVDIYGGNMYPDEIDPIGSGLAITYYNGGTSKGSGVRSTIGTAKIVYLGFDPSMVTSDEVRNDLIAMTYDWFMHGVGMAEINKSDISVFPNPFNERLSITLSNTIEANLIIELFDVLGSKVYKQEITSSQVGQQTISIEPKHLKNGVYIVVVKNGSLVYQQQVILNK